MKYILLFLGIIFVIISAFLLLIFSPYFIYLQTINQGFSSSFLTMEVGRSFMLRPAEFKIKKMDEFLAQNEKRWRSFHFANYKIPLPLQHPTLSLIPVISQVKGKYYFGGDIFDNENFRKFRFIEGEALKLDNFIYKQKVFELPLFKKDLEGIPSPKFFKILFTYNILLKGINKKSKLSYLQSLWKIPYRDLIFNLFILNARNSFFPKDMIQFTFYPEKEMGIVETGDKNPNFYNEAIYILRGMKIYIFKYRVRKGDLQADAIRSRFLKNIQFEESYEDKRIESYNDFRNLSYKQKISSVGFTYLYAGFTHVPGDQTYYTAMIKDLEKRPGNAKFITPLYQYGKKVFKLEKKVDKKEKKIKAKGFDQEDARTIKETGKENEAIDVELTKEEKINLYLEDAKDRKGLESEEGVLEMD